MSIRVLVEHDATVLRACQAGRVPHIVDPGPWIQARLAEETAPLRAQLAEATSSKERARLRWQIWRTSAHIRRTFRGGGPVKF